MRYAKRVDANQSEIIAAFERLGCSVIVIGEPVDLVVYMPWNGVRQNVFVEIKDGSKPPSAQKHTQQQVKFFAEWPGPKVTVRSVDDVLSLLSRTTA
jgi:hypothetical protein